MTERVTHAELLSFRRELLESIPVALRERLKDIDHLLGWPPDPGISETAKLIAEDWLDSRLGDMVNLDGERDELFAKLASLFGYSNGQVSWTRSES